MINDIRLQTINDVEEAIENLWTANQRMGIYGLDLYEISKALDKLKAEIGKTSYWTNITRIYQRQRNKGIKNYGQRLEENSKLTTTEKITMLEEELVDGLMYLEHLKAGVVNE